MNPSFPIISVDLFAGGGGASEGIRRATGHAPYVAVNHCPHAIAMHAANHPGTIHLQESVHDVAPLDYVRGMPVDLLWASPDCTHFSRAKGGKPRKQEIRSLAWVVVDWARVVAPKVIIVENVAEFQTWGPLDEDGQPIKAQAGETFAAFVHALRETGYQVEWRVLAACDYGAPTTRQRLFLVARRGFTPIRWPAPTHGPGRALPWRTAAECIDWSIPSCSIFATPAEAKAWRKEVGAVGTPRRPLAEATMRRIAEGLRRFVLESPDPYIVATGHQSSDAGKVRGVGEPLSTVVTKAEHLLVTPYVMHHRGQSVGRSMADPLPTVTATAQGHLALMAPTLIQTGYGERKGQTPRVLDLGQPLGTVVAAGQKHALVAAWLAKHYGGPNGHPCYGADLGRPLGAITGRDSQGPVVAYLDKLHGSARAGQPVDQPLPTVTAGGGRGGGHAALVAAFLTKFYGQGSQAQSVGEPLHTIVTKARFGLVTVELDGQPYVVTDIAMRMLQPRELARAQGFGDDYILIGTKSQQVARIGNSVAPPVVQALVEAQFGLNARAVLSGSEAA